MSILTLQQKAIIKGVQDSDGDIVLVKARAGTGKTSTSLAVVDALKPKKALYTAFNRAIVEEGKEKFTSNVECRTLHSLALSYVRPKNKIEDFTYLCIKEKLGYPSKLKIINAVDEFYRSDSTDMDDFLEDLLEEYPKLIPLAVKYINQMVNDEIPPTFNFLLKYFHLLMHEEQIQVKYDLVILDEIQDSTGVALAIFKLIESPRKLGLGDPDQSIYEFMKLVNGFDILTDAKVFELTKSFRCSETIAKAVEKFGQKYLSNSFDFKGIDVPKEDGLTAYITATNAQIVYRLNELHSEGQGYTLTRPIKDIFACPLALSNAAAGREVYHKRYKFLEKEYRQYTTSGMKSFFSYLKANVADEEIHNSIDLLMRFKKTKINIFEVLKDAKATKSDKAITVGTGFSLKGLEFSTVYIEDDLNRAIENILEHGGPTSDKEHTIFKVYYVAVTRSRKYLRNAKHLKDL